MVDERVEGRVGVRAARGLVGELEAACRAHPLGAGVGAADGGVVPVRASGRALQVFQELPGRVGEELGIEPSPALARIEQAILMRPVAGAGAGGAGRSAGRGGARGAAPGFGIGPGVVTLLFTDVVASTELLERLGDEAYDVVRREHFGVLRRGGGGWRCRG